MRSMRHAILSFFLICWAANFTQAAFIVEGDSNPWLAGMPDGATAAGGDDLAPAQSPTLVNISLIPGAALQFSASGSVSNGQFQDFYGPDGFFDGFLISIDAPENGIANINAPLDALVGVFLDDTQPNLTSAPDLLDFAATGNVPGGVNYLTISPLLKQIFFIGDGLTSGNVQQQIIVPNGATRLYLGIMDSEEWNNNRGSFEVNVRQVTGTNTPEPSSLALIGLGIATMLGYRARTGLRKAN